jgi:hypothetical protein
VSTPTTPDTSGARANCDRAGAGPGIEGDLVAREGAEQTPHSLREIGGTLVLEREPQVDAQCHLLLARELARKRECLLARRDRPRCPLLVDDVEDTSDLGTGLEPELVAADERRGRVGLPRRLHCADELLRSDVCERVEGPRLRLPTEAVNGRAATSPPACARDGAPRRSA